MLGAHVLECCRALRKHCFDTHQRTSKTFRPPIALDRACQSHLRRSYRQTLSQPPTTEHHASPKLPYSPLVAKELDQIAELTRIACTYLEDTGDDSLQAQISTLELHHQPNMDAALKLLQGAKKARVLHTTLEFAKNLKKARTADELEKSAESARRLLR